MRNGKSIRIYKDQSLPNVRFSKAFSPSKLNMDARVADLINEVGFRKEGLIR